MKTIPTSSLQTPAAWRTDLTILLSLAWLFGSVLLIVPNYTCKAINELIDLASLPLLLLSSWLLLTKSEKSIGE